MQKRSFSKYFKKNESGKYEFKGKIYVYDGDDRTKSLLIIWLLFAVLSAAGITLGMLPLNDMMNSTYVRLPIVFSLCTWAFFLLTMVKFAFAGKEIKEYDFRPTVVTLPIASFLHSLVSFAQFVTLIVFVCINGFNDEVLLYIFTIVLALLSTTSSILLFIKFRKIKWVEKE